MARWETGDPDVMEYEYSLICCNTEGERMGITVKQDTSADISVRGAAPRINGLPCAARRLL